METNAIGGKYFVVLLKALAITIFTLGIGTPIAQLMVHKYLVETISISHGFDFDSVQQTEESYKDATGDDMGDIGSPVQ